MARASFVFDRRAPASIQHVVRTNGYEAESEMSGDEVGPTPPPHQAPSEASMGSTSALHRPLSVEFLAYIPGYSPASPPYRAGSVECLAYISSPRADRPPSRDSLGYSRVSPPLSPSSREDSMETSAASIRPPSRNSLGYSRVSPSYTPSSMEDSMENFLASDRPPTPLNQPELPPFSPTDLEEISFYDRDGNLIRYRRVRDEAT